jgi:hypothetical protein
MEPRDLTGALERELHIQPHLPRPKHQRRHDAVVLGLSTGGATLEYSCT